VHRLNPSRAKSCQGWMDGCQTHPAFAGPFESMFKFLETSLTYRQAHKARLLSYQASGQHPPPPLADLENAVGAQSLDCKKRTRSANRE
jgi:hypothetical protein